VLELPTGQRGGMRVPVTYMLGGKQYIALMGGSGLAGFRGQGGEARPPPPVLKLQLLVYLELVIQFWLRLQRACQNKRGASRNVSYCALRQHRISR
jgi:hypothetical protein